MKPKYLITLLVSVMLWHAPASAQDIDKELADLTERLAAPIKERSMKKVTVLDFTDLQGSSKGELGKYIAEQLTVNFVLAKRDFSVLDRANLRKILSEHKLTATGLVDPENAKKLGMFAGVDTLILGTIIPKGNNISLTAKIITTETAEIIGAARAEFAADSNVQQLIAQPSTESPGGVPPDDKAKVTKTFGDLRVELMSLKAARERYLLTLQLVNQNPKKSLWVAVRRSYNGGELNGVITDGEGSQFRGQENEVTGVECSGLSVGNFAEATQIKAGESISATVAFRSPERQTPATGSCQLQLEFISGLDFSRGYGPGTVHNLITKINAE